MRNLILFGGKEGIQRIECKDEEFGLYSRALTGDCENHNAVNPPEEHWTWGEEGTATDPTMTDEERAAAAGQVETDRINALSKENQAIELEAILDGLAGYTDAMERKAKIRGQVFDAPAWFTTEAAKVKPKYTKVN